MTRLELGEMYFTHGGVLGRRFLGGVLWMSQQILSGGYANPTQAQTDWANAVTAMDSATLQTESGKSLQWGLVNNTTLQSVGNAVEDTAIDYIVAEYANTYA